VPARERGAAFARAWADGLPALLAGLARTGARIGTAHAERPGMRTFGYRRQFTVLARLTAGELQIVRLYFRGQDRQRRGWRIDSGTRCPRAPPPASFPPREALEPPRPLPQRLQEPAT